MYSSHLLEIAVVAAACSYIVWVVVSSRHVLHDRCGLCGHMYYTHDPVNGDCRGRADGRFGHDSGTWTFCAHDLRCGCHGFIEDPQVGRHPDLTTR
ncbi:hypothetical protein [Nocardia thraciensis]